MEYLRYDKSTDQYLDGEGLRGYDYYNVIHPHKIMGSDYFSGEYAWARVYVCLYRGFVVRLKDGVYVRIVDKKCVEKCRSGEKIRVQLLDSNLRVKEEGCISAEDVEWELACALERVKDLEGNRYQMGCVIRPADCYVPPKGEYRPPVRKKVLREFWRDNFIVIAIVMAIMAYAFS